MDGRRRRIAWVAAVTMTASLGLAACGDDGASGGATHLTWYINPDGGGSDPAGGGQAQLAKECSDASGGAYTIGIQLLPNSASDQRQQLLIAVGVALVTGWWDQFIVWVRDAFISDTELPV